VAEPSPFGALEAVLGHEFRDRGLLELALRHASWCNEHANTGQEDNERLEFLGDAVLGLVVGQRLMTRFGELRQGELSKMRAQVVSEVGLSQAARKVDLGRWLSLGKGEEKSGGRTKPSILADAFEAILAAVYLDGGFEAAEGMVTRLLAERISTVEPNDFYDFKTRLQETAQARLRATPTYRVVQELGPDHEKQFVVAVSITDEEWGRAVGKSKKEAEQMAAAEAHFKLEGSDAGVKKKSDKKR
jgi:ribonuclease III